MEEEKLFEAAEFLKKFCKEHINYNGDCNCPLADSVIECKLADCVPTYWNWDEIDK